MTKNQAAAIVMMCVISCPTHPDLQRALIKNVPLLGAAADRQR